MPLDYLFLYSLMTMRIIFLIFECFLCKKKDISLLPLFTVLWLFCEVLSPRLTGYLDFFYELVVCFHFSSSLGCQYFPFCSIMNIESIYHFSYQNCWIFFIVTLKVFCTSKSAKHFFFMVLFL